MAYNKKLYKTDDSVIDSSVIYDDTQKKLQSEINTSVTSSISSLNDSSNHAIKDNVAAQTISGSTASANLKIKNNASGAVKLTADNEGGNLRLEKGKMHVELDTNDMSTDGTGYSRLYLNSNESSEINKSFMFRQDGSFTDGNGVNTGTLNSTKVSKTGDTMTGDLALRYATPKLWLRNSNTDVTDVTYSDGVSPTVMMIQDKNNQNVAQIADRFEINGATGLIVGGCKRWNNQNHWNYLRLLVNKDSSGNAVNEVIVTSPGAWRSALGVLPFSGTPIIGTDTTSAASDFAGSIVTILTSNAPQGWDPGVYIGKLQKTNSGTQVGWQGLYVLYVSAKNTNYATQGIAAVQGNIFNIWYRAGVWTATKMAAA